MTVWLEQHKPELFDELLTSTQVIDALKHLALQANPPHLLLSGPSGCGKTAALHLVCRQVLGPSWRATTHVLQARDLDKTSGAMAKFEALGKGDGGGSGSGEERLRNVLQRAKESAGIDVEQSFALFDKDGGGTADKAEFKEGLTALGIEGLTEADVDETTVE